MLNVNDNENENENEKSIKEIFPKKLCKQYTAKSNNLTHAVCVFDLTNANKSKKYHNLKWKLMWVVTTLHVKKWQKEKKEISKVTYYY